VVVKVIVWGIAFCSCIKWVPCVVFDREFEGGTLKMCERQNTIYVLLISGARVSTYEIHECIYAQMCLSDQEATMLQNDRPKRHVCVKFRDNERMQDVLQSTGGQVEYRHTSSEISIIRISTA